jgi:hypothetical protein
MHVLRPVWLDVRFACISRLRRVIERSGRLLDAVAVTNTSSSTHATHTQSVMRALSPCSIGCNHFGLWPSSTRVQECGIAQVHHAFFRLRTPAQVGLCCLTPYSQLGAEVNAKVLIMHRPVC